MRIKTPFIIRVVTVVTLIPLIVACESELFSEHNATNTPNQIAPKNTTPESQERLWEMSQQTDNKLFSIKLSCQQKPFVGDFQKCHILLKHDDKGVSDAKISIDGGMKAHGHGLPTSPKLSATNILGQYSIKGLKFSMPGDWVVGFRVKKDGLSDQSIFNFSI